MHHKSLQSVLWLVGLWLMAACSRVESSHEPDPDDDDSSADDDDSAGDDDDDDTANDDDDVIPSFPFPFTHPPQAYYYDFGGSINEFYYIDFFYEEGNLSLGLHFTYWEEHPERSWLEWVCGSEWGGNLGVYSKEDPSRRIQAFGLRESVALQFDSFQLKYRGDPIDELVGSCGRLRLQETFRDPTANPSDLKPEVFYFEGARFESQGDFEPIDFYEGCFGF